MVFMIKIRFKRRYMRKMRYDCDFINENRMRYCFLVIGQAMCHPLPYKLQWFNEFVKKRDDVEIEMEEIGEDNPSVILARKRAEWLAIKEQSLERRPICYRTPYEYRAIQNILKPFFESRVLFQNNLESVINLH